MFSFLRKQCIKHEWLANAMMIGGSLLFGVTVVAIVLFRNELLIWVNKNLFLHPILLGAAVIFEVLLFFGISRLVFADCSEEQEKHQGGYAGRKSRETPAAGVIQKMGVNPKRR